MFGLEDNSQAGTSGAADIIHSGVKMQRATPGCYARPRAVRFNSVSVKTTITLGMMKKWPFIHPRPSLEAGISTHETALFS